MVEVRVPKYTGWGSAYEKFVRVAQQWAIAGVAATVRTDGGTIAEARLALTNMGPTPVRARAAEQALAGVAVLLYAILRLVFGPLPQWPSYHDFADTRQLWIVPRAGASSRQSRLM